MRKKLGFLVLVIFAVVGIVNISTFIDLLLQFKTNFILGCIGWFTVFLIDHKLVENFV